MQEFGLDHVAADELAHDFVEFRPHLGNCKFNDCKHLTEPGCAVAAAVERGEIRRQRVDSYRKLVTQLMQKEKRWN